MRTANMPAGHGRDPGSRDPATRDAERLAAAIEQGRSPGSVGDPTLARDLRLVRMLQARGADLALDPTADAKARARARLRAAMAAPATPPVAAELTSPIAPVVGQDEQERADLTQTAEFGRLLDDRDAETASAAGGPDVSGPNVSGPNVSGPNVSGPNVSGPNVSGPNVSGPNVSGPNVTAPDVAAARPRRRSRHSKPSRPSSRAGASARPAARGLRRRVALVAVASLVALVAIAVGGDLASRSALPGDALYAFKRASENMGVALTFDDQARAQRHLELATSRVDEVERLVAADPAREVDAAVVEDVIAEFDDSTGEGSRSLLAAQDASGPAVLGDLQAWASDQAARLSVLRSSLPEPAVGELDGSLALLDRLVGRTEALEARSDCSEVTSTVVDDLGPLAAEGTCTPRPAGEAPVAPEAGTSSTDATEDGGTAPTTDGNGSTDPTTDGSTTTGTEPGLLPELGPDGLPLPDADVPASATPDDGTGGDVSLPLPLLPPIQLPPLLPGLPGVSIG